MQVKSIADLEHSAILLTFIKLPFVIKTYVLSILEWPFYTGFTVDKIHKKLFFVDFTDVSTAANTPKPNVNSICE